jgi:hypothetical protein
MAHPAARGAGIDVDAGARSGASTTSGVAAPSQLTREADGTLEMGRLLRPRRAPLRQSAPGRS